MARATFVTLVTCRRLVSSSIWSRKFQVPSAQMINLFTTAPPIVFLLPSLPLCRQLGPDPNYAECAMQHERPMVPVRRRTRVRAMPGAAAGDSTPSCAGHFLNGAAQHTEVAG